MNLPTGQLRPSLPTEEPRRDGAGKTPSLSLLRRSCQLQTPLPAPSQGNSTSCSHPWNLLSVQRAPSLPRLLSSTLPKSHPGRGYLVSELGPGVWGIANEPHFLHGAQDFGVHRGGSPGNTPWAQSSTCHPPRVGSGTHLRVILSVPPSSAPPQVHFPSQQGTWQGSSTEHGGVGGRKREKEIPHGQSRGRIPLGGRLDHVPPSSHLPSHTSPAGNSSGVSLASRNDASGSRFYIFQILQCFSV